MYPVNIPLVSLSNHYVSLPLGSFVTTMDGKWMNSPYIPRLFRDGKLRIPKIFFTTCSLVVYLPL